MRAYMLEKLVLVVNNARIIFNGLNPMRPAIGIYDACERIIDALVQPYLDDMAIKRKQHVNKRPGQGAEDGRDMTRGSRKKQRTSWSSNKCWRPDMAVELRHLPAKIPEHTTEELVDGKTVIHDHRRSCRQCSRKKRGQHKTEFYCPDCTASNGGETVWLCGLFNKHACWQTSHATAPVLGGEEADAEEDE